MFKIYKVRGVSMTPLYVPGDYILCKGIKDINEMKIGDIVIAMSKNYGKILKKVDYIDLDKNICRLKGLNPESLSTEEMGNIPLDRPFYKVLFRLKKGPRLKPQSKIRI
ncbi:MAG: S24/S26 family peptidase [Tissierellia bacterium]|nr:S24/S26 family peptidase [Tissierellia bacterium]